MVTLTKHDLLFILKQIEIAEAHAAGGDLAELVAGYNGNDGLTQAHLLPYGLRTVDGSYNNLLPGRENWGAADQSFPGIFTPAYLNDADGDRYDFNPSPTSETWYSNNNYANAGPGSGSSPGPGSGTVIDADPRLISNLIVDQTLNNPAAIAAALTHAGLSGQALMGALSQISNAHTILKAIPGPGEGQTPSAAYALAREALDAALAQYGVEMDGNTVFLPNVSPDDGLSSPFNGWMTIFGQFFDHGLDLVAKGGNGTVYVPLQPDDPLYVPGGQNYIPLTRVSVSPGPDNILGTADDGPGPKNLTTPWIDQNQTYASTASKQVFMREYVAGPDGKPIATGHLLEGASGGLATWADIKAQARDMLGIELTDLNVGNIPLIAADEYGNFIRGPNGYPQLVVGMGSDGVLGTADDVLREGNPAAPVSAQGVVLTGHAFLDDIAHAAVPVIAGGVLVADGDSALGYANADGSPGPQGQRGPTAYDNELLDRHFIAGDGRANENIALTAVHQVFHAEHNRVVEMTKQVALDSGDLAFLNDWLLVDVTALPASQAEIDALVWDGERLFQAGRFTNEMEYQHLVFEEFGRMMQPDIDVFVFEPSADINPSIAAEFAHVVYRFGHSMLRQDIAIIGIDEDGKPVIKDVSLFEGFLNPVMYDSLGDAEAASGAIIRGMSRQTGSEIDEFVTDVLRNQLLGIPLDLATINIARGRDVGMPSLQTARTTFYEATGDTLLKPYTSWADFALNLKNPASIINFIAAYGTHESVLNTPAAPKTVEQLREAATLLVLGGAGAPADRLDFLNATGAYADDSKLGGLNDIDFWMGGLAEKKMSFGGMLGSTFAFTFQMTMENLQDADRFYYLSRTQGLNLLNELENNTFAELVMRNTDLGDPGSTALPGNLFSAFQMPTLEMDPSLQLGADPAQDNPFLPFANLVERRDANGVLIAAGDTETVAAYIRVNSNEHFTIGGTEGNDTIVSGGGDDAIWGKGGNDRIEAGYGVDKVFGGEGDDIITNAGTDIGEADFLHGNEGNDVIHGGSGLSLIFGNQGSDFIVTGPDGKEAFGGTGTDFILGGSGNDFLLGNEGDDWLEGGQRFDTLAGENSELFFNSTIVGHDVMNGGSGDTDYDGESGDDIAFQNSEGIQRTNGMAGFDWAIHKGDSQAANSNLGIPIFETQEAFILRDRFDLVEGLSGWRMNDVLTGRSVAVNTRAELTGTAAVPGPDSPLDSYSNALLEKNVDLITGLRELVAHIARTTQTGMNGVTEQVVMDTADASDILLGGGGSDIITGLAGNDVIDGDKWLNVRILVTPTATQTWEAFSVDSMAQISARMMSGEINPGQLSIVREMLDGNVAGDIDTAVYTDLRANYTFGNNSDGSIFIDHTGFVKPQADDDLPEGEEGLLNPLSDGRDTIRGIEKLNFTTANPNVVDVLNVIEGTNASETINGTAQDDLINGRDGNDTLNGLGGNDILLGGAGVDTLNGGDGADILVGGAGGAGTGGTYADTFNAATFTNSNGSTPWSSAWVETADNSGISSATAGQIRISGGQLQFRDDDNDTGNGTATIQRSLSLAGATNATISYDFDENSFDAGEVVTVTFAADGVNFNQTIQVINGNSGGGTTNVALTGPFGATAAIRFVVSGTNNNSSSDVVSIDNLTVTYSSAQTLNGGAGDDSYVIGLNDGANTINETSGVDRIVIGAGVLTGLSSFEVNAGNTGSGTDDLRIAFNGTQITVTDHFDQAGEAVEAINLDGASYQGYAFDGDYALSTDDNGDRTAAGGVNTLIAGTTGADDLIGGTGGDLLFGHDGNDTLVGDAGDDLLVGGGGNDELDGGAGADTMIGGTGNDTYAVDDIDDVVVELAEVGIDTVETTLDAYTLAANIENLSYTGAAAFTGAGNELDNVIIGGAGADTLTGLGGNDTYVVTAGDVIVEAAGGGTDTVSSSASYTLGAELENLTLTGGGATNGTGNAVANAIIGNDGANQLFGAGGDDNINGGDGADLIDGGEGNDALNGGAGNDTDTIIGGAGNDTIDVSNGNDLIRYTASGFGADTITGFDATATGGQDLIDLSALGITAANLSTRVIESTVGGNTILTVRDAALATIGTIQLNNVSNAAIDATDYILAAELPPPFGAATNGANTITGNGAANLIDGLGGNDLLNGGGGNDVLIGGEGADTLNGGDGNDTLSGGIGSNTGSLVDQFGAQSYTNNNGAILFAGNWIEGGGETTSASGGDIDISGGRLRFGQTVDGGETIERAMNLAGATSATVTFAYEDDNLGAGQSVIVQARNVTTNAWETLSGGTLGSTTPNGNGAFGANLTANQIGANSAIRFLTAGDGSNWDNGDNFYVDNFAVTVSMPGLNAGVDTVNGDAGDDTIIWNANASGATDGRDIVNGGVEGSAGDTFVINGNASTETYTIYTRTAWLAVAGNLAANLNASTEIVITRNGSNNASVIAELREIEEIRINGVDPGASGGVASGDTFQVIGDFSTTSLRPNTITINGSSADDLVDITGLTSEHRIVFTSNGGEDTIRGEKRAQDEIHVTAEGTLVDDRVVGGGVDDENDNHDNEHQDDDDHDDDSHADDQDEDRDQDHNAEDEDADLVLAGGSGDDKLLGGSAEDVINGGSGDDTLKGGSGDDALNGGSGDDILLGGSGDDQLKGGSGDDELVGGSGEDVLDGGSGDDVLTGGSGADIFRFGAGDAITDFELGDRIDLSAENVTAANFSEKVIFSQSGGDAWLKIGASKMLLSGVKADDLDLMDFILAEGSSSSSEDAGHHNEPSDMVAEAMRDAGDTASTLAADGSRTLADKPAPYGVCEVIDATYYL
ncbi:MAG: heme peroxidase [Alphaproteobacteria bacterium]|nr:MAG: heme peroxidase [Alphaproteobacteria bacterium]